MREAAAVIRNAQRAMRAATGQRKGRLHRAINDLHTVVGRTERVVAQTRSRHPNPKQHPTAIPAHRHRADKSFFRSK